MTRSSDRSVASADRSRRIRAVASACQPGHATGCSRRPKVVIVPRISNGAAKSRWFTISIGAERRTSSRQAGGLAVRCLVRARVDAGLGREAIGVSAMTRLAAEAVVGWPAVGSVTPSLGDPSIDPLYRPSLADCVRQAGGQFGVRNARARYPESQNRADSAIPCLRMRPRTTRDSP